MYCNVDFQQSYDVVCDVPDFMCTDINTLADVFSIGYMVAPRDGVLTTIGTYTFSTDATAPESLESAVDYGFQIAICSEKDNETGRIIPPITSDNNSWNENYKVINSRGQPRWFGDPAGSALPIEAGTEFEVYIIGKSCTVSGSTMKVVLI